MAKKVKLPGDILKTMKAIGSKNVTVTIKGSDDKVIQTLTLTRDKYDALLKCSFIKMKSDAGDDVPTGFFTVDNKKQEADIFLACRVGKDTFIKVNEHTFKVMQPFKGWTYA